MRDFGSLGISLTTVKTLKEQGLVTPTPVQQQAIPSILNKKDLIAQAQTGTGKTLAFVLPILEKIDVTSEHLQALIVTPTRELALQITDEIEKLIAHVEGLDVLAVYGGQDVDKQLKKLKKNIQLVVGTPGRLLDHIRRGTVDFSKLDFLVLDEADQMLHIGFLSEVEDIIKETPTTRQTLLFSATIPPEVRKLAKKHMKDPEYVQVEKTQGPAQTVKQMAVHTTDRAKQATLIQLIEMHRPFLAVVFCRTKRRVTKLYDALKAHRFSVDELHGDLSQAKREQVMKRFRDAEIQLLVATDVAARGLDVEGVTHVFNYDIPQDPESYIHRIGRTGRAGMSGIAVTLYSTDDRPALDAIEKELNIRIEKNNLGNVKKSEGSEKESNSSHKPRSGKKKGHSQKATQKPEGASKSPRKSKPVKGKVTGAKFKQEFGKSSGGPSSKGVNKPRPNKNKTKRRER